MPNENNLKQTTLCLLVREDEILLAMKKRGFGKDKWNGYGGKPHEGEDLVAAAVRETQEEIGVAIDPEDLQHLGRMEFYFEHNPDWNQEVNVYKARKWTGEPVETEEMRPQWFPVSEIPFDQMWLEDKYWMAKFLADQKFEGEFYYNKDGSDISKYDLREI
jgi:8-oxo-dGTP pyrophosphatase MutT (NUDIX family)